MSHTVLPAAMSIPEVMGDPCATGIRRHAEALLAALSHADRLVDSHPQVGSSVADLKLAVAEHAPAILARLAEVAGVPAEGESISRTAGRHGDYRRDRSSGCWIWMRSVSPSGFPVSGRKTSGRHNVAARIYWMLAFGAIPDDSLVVRTCGMRLCVNPAHGRLADRREHGRPKRRSGRRVASGTLRRLRQNSRLPRRSGRSVCLARRAGVSGRSPAWISP